MTEKTDVKGMMIALLRKNFETDSITQAHEDIIIYNMAAAFKAGTEFRAKTAIEKVCELTRQNQALSQKLERYEKALEFYADKTNWLYDSAPMHENVYVPAHLGDREERDLGQGDEYKYYTGGKIAREALKAGG